MILSDVYFGGPKLEPFSKTAWEIKLSRNVVCAQGILNEVSKSACRWTRKARMGLLVGILVSSPVAMTRYFIRSNLWVYLGLQVFREYSLPWRKKLGGRQIRWRWMLLRSHVSGQEAQNIQEAGSGCKVLRPSPNYPLLPAWLYVLKAPQPSKDSTTHWGLSIQTNEAMGTFHVHTVTVFKEIIKPYRTECLQVAVV